MHRNAELKCVVMLDVGFFSSFPPSPPEGSFFFCLRRRFRAFRQAFTIFGFLEDQGVQIAWTKHKDTRRMSRKRTTHF